MSCLRGMVSGIPEQNLSLIYRQERDDALATIGRVEALANTWSDPGVRTQELAEVRSADGDDSLARALGIGRAYADALRSALEEPT